MSTTRKTVVGSCDGLLAVSKVSLVLACSLALAACGGSGSDDPDEAIVMPTTQDPSADFPQGPSASDGQFNPALLDLVSEAQLQGVVDLGFTINDGDQPPNIEGTFFSSPTILQASALSSDQESIGDRFNDVEVSFSNQDNGSLTADLVLTLFEGDGGGDIEDVFASEQSVLLGNGSLFSAFFLIDDMIFAFSGSIGDDGISNPQEATFDLADSSATDSSEIGGRLFIDGDGFAERISEVLPAPVVPTVPVTPTVPVAPTVPTAPTVPVSQVDSGLSPLIGTVTFDVDFFGNDLEFIDVITFSPESLTTLNSGDQALVAVSDILGVEYVCTLATSDLFLCVYVPEPNSIEVTVFSFSEPGVASGAVEFCTFESDTESCDLEDLIDRLVDNPEGAVDITVVNAMASLQSPATFDQDVVSRSHLSDASLAKRQLAKRNRLSRSEAEFISKISRGAEQKTLNLPSGSLDATALNDLRNQVRSLIVQ